MEPLPDPTLGARFEVMATFAGGEGRTWHVRERRGGRELALKVLDGEGTAAEGTLLASLRHPRIPSLVEVGRLDDGRAFLLREFVAGEPLSRLLPLPVDEAVRLATQVLEVLAYVHLRAVLHLDLKPGNLLRRADGDWALLDFGLGRRAGERGRGGTPFFAAPEILLGTAPDARSDLFSLAAVLVVALGRRPDLARFLRLFPREGFFAAAGLDAASLPPPFDGLLPQLVARNPLRRLPDAQAALERLTGGSGRPEPSLLRPDPVRWHGADLHRATGALGAHEDLALTGADAETRRLLALHLCCTLEGCHGLLADGERTLVQRGGQGPRLLRLPRLGREQIAAHLVEVLSLPAAAAGTAADWLLARGADGPGAVGELLLALVAAGRVQPDGTRWTWPEAAAGRLADGAVDATEPAEDAAGPPTPAAVRAAARRGRPEQAILLYRRGAAAPEREPELRAALIEGFLAAGEPARALPLAHDRPLDRCQALLDLGRPAEAGRALAAAGAPAREPDRRRAERLAAQLAFARGDLAAAEAKLLALPRVEAPEERITLAIVQENRGDLAAARATCERVLARLDPEREPYLLAAALTCRSQIDRRAGDLVRSRDGFRRAQELLFGLGHVAHAATACRNLGVVEKDLGNLTAAVAELRRARSLYRYVRAEAGVAVTEANLGIVELEAGDPAAAVRRLSAAAARLQELGAGREAALALAALGRAEELAARPAPAPTPHAEPAQQEPRDQEPAVTTEPGVSRELFRTFLAVNRRLAAESDLGRAMEHLLDAAVTLTGGRQGYLLLQRPDGLRLECRAGDAPPGGQAFSRSLANRALQERRTLTGEDALALRELADMPSIRNLDVRSAVCTPFVSAAGAAGAIYVEHGGRAGVFGDREKEHLEILADQAAIAVDRMLREEQLAQELEHSRREVLIAQRGHGRRRPTRILGRSPQIAALREQIDRLAPLDLPVLILGETGTGKELVARALHESGPRHKQAFVAENCSALPAELMERELFGHVRGAFTGADSDRPGLLELASGGTLFLDEVGDMPPALQVKLLRALQEQSIRRVGAQEPVSLDLRLVTATHKDLAAMVERGEFRQDLYYRIAAVEVTVPPLRERTGDVELLAGHFVERFNKEHRTDKRLAAAALRAMVGYRWPGNVRELEHVVARACLLSDGAEITDPQLPAAGPGVGAAAGGAKDAAPERGLEAKGPADAEWPVITLQEAEARTIRAALRQSGGDKSKAARTLAISRTALYEKLKRMQGGET